MMKMMMSFQDSSAALSADPSASPRKRVLFGAHNAQSSAHQAPPTLAPALTPVVARPVAAAVKKAPKPVDVGFHFIISIYTPMVKY